MINKIICNLIGRVWLSKKYESWRDAKINSLGYENINVFNKIKKIYEIQGVRKKFYEFYERDGILFDSKIYDSKILNFIKKIKKKKKSISILDFGGSLGSIYFSNYNYISKNNLTWNIVEQKNFVKYGKKNLQKENLNFFYEIDHCLKIKSPDIALFSGSLQYTQNPYEILKKIINSKIKYIFLHNVPFNNDISDEYRIQFVPNKINESSYPITIFSLLSFKLFLAKNNLKIAKIVNVKSPFYKIKYKTIEIINDKSNL
jgi:putative methyltransferase (TIGR04325 family)